VSGASEKKRSCGRGRRRWAYEREGRFSGLFFFMLLRKKAETAVHKEN